jgi:hypothetical protein
MFRLRCLLVACVLAATGCTSDTSPQEVTLSSANLVRGGFSLAMTTHGLALITGDSEIAVRDADLSAGKEDYLEQAATAIDESTLAVTANSRLGLVKKDGSATSVECRGCVSVMWTGHDLVVLMASTGEGQTFDLVSFGRDLQRTGSVTLRRLTERTDPEQQRNVSEVSLLAANDATVWLAYTDRFGFARGGSRTIAAYSREGRLLRSTRVPGLIYSKAISSDGRYLAVADGGSGGACLTIGELDVIDLVAMRGLDTSPRIPNKALLEAAPNDVPSLNFAADELVWRGATLFATGETSRGNDPAGKAACDLEARRWIREYDTTTQSFSDKEATRDIGVYVGPACEDRGKRVSNSDKWEVIGKSRRQWVFQGQFLYRPSPQDCVVK